MTKFRPCIDLHDGKVKQIVGGSLRDDGAGFDVAAAAAAAGAQTGGLSSKFGLFSIRERMQALGGSFDIQSTPGNGTTATLTLPLSTAR